MTEIVMDAENKELTKDGSGRSVTKSSRPNLPPPPPPPVQLKKSSSDNIKNEKAEETETMTVDDISNTTKAKPLVTKPKPKLNTEKMVKNTRTEANSFPKTVIKTKEGLENSKGSTTTTTVCKSKRIDSSKPTLPKKPHIGKKAASFDEQLQARSSLSTTGQTSPISRTISCLTDNKRGLIKATSLEKSEEKIETGKPGSLPRCIDNKQSFNLTVALKKAANQKLDCPNNNYKMSSSSNNSPTKTPPKPPASHLKPSLDKLKGFNDDSRGSTAMKSTEETKSEDIPTVAKSPNIQEQIKVWGKGNKDTKPSKIPTASIFSKNSGIKSNRRSSKDKYEKTSEHEKRRNSKSKKVERKPSAKFYTDDNDEELKIKRESAGSCGSSSSTFYIDPVSAEVTLLSGDINRLSERLSTMVPGISDSLPSPKSTGKTSSDNLEAGNKDKVTVPVTKVTAPVTKVTAPVTKVTAPVTTNKLSPSKKTSTMTDIATPYMPPKKIKSDNENSTSTYPHKPLPTPPKLKTDFSETKTPKSFCPMNRVISPPLPRKTSTAYRDSTVISYRDSSPSPVAPLRKKKTIHKQASELVASDSVTAANRPDSLKRMNSTSFTTEDFDLFQKRFSREEVLNGEDQKENTGNEADNKVNGAQHSGNIIRKAGSRRTIKRHDRDKRRSKSVGALGFNMFGVKLKPVAVNIDAVKTAQLIRANQNEDSESEQPSEKWIHKKLQLSEKRRQQNLDSGVYDNNFEAVKPNKTEVIESSSLQSQLNDYDPEVYENVNRESQIYGDIEIKKNEAGRNDLASGSANSTLNRYTALSEENLSHEEETNKYKTLNTSSDNTNEKSEDKSITLNDNLNLNVSLTDGNNGNESDKTPPNELDSPVPISEDDISQNRARRIVEHVYSVIDEPPGRLGAGISTENLYDEIELNGSSSNTIGSIPVIESDHRNDESHTVQPQTHSSVNDSEIATSNTNYRPPLFSKVAASQLTDELDPQDQLKLNLNLKRNKSNASLNKDDPVGQIERKLTRKLSRKLTRKESRKLSRKFTRKLKEKKNIHLQKLLIDDESDDETGDHGDDEEFFSETDSEFDDDSFTDESDIERERALISTFPEDKQEAIAAIYEVNVPRVQRIAMELLSTEKSYVDKLTLLDQKFHFQIVLENRQQKMFPDEMIPQMFSNIKSIYQFHHDFLLPKLEERMSEWDKTPKIGDVMKKFAPFLKLYTEYVQNFEHGNQVINTWLEKSPKFSSLIMELQKMPESEHLSLQHHMLSPIQRVPRYEMLLKDYQKHLPENSDDKSDTEKALELVTTAAKHSNEVMRKNEKFRKLLDLNQTLGGTVNLVSPTRELVKEGKIIKIAARNGLLQERYLYLFSDMLLVCQSIPVTLMQQYKVKARMDIQGMQVIEGDNLETPNTFYVKTTHKILEFHAETSDEKLDWQVVLWNVIGDFTKKMQSRGEMKDLKATYYDGVNDKLGKHPPKWIKDQETSQCMICAVVFTILRRRHHCRACGKVVCGRCSDYEAKLEYEKNKTKRVCSDCFTRLDKGTTIISHPVLTSQPAPRRKGVLNVKASDPSVLSGYLQMTLDKKTWTKRYFAIHQDFVLYSFKAHQDVRALTSMPLPGYIAAEVSEKDEIDKDLVFKLSHSAATGGVKVYFFQAEDMTTKKQWMRILSFVVQAELPSTNLKVDRSESII